jgi:predicted HicB family RNase H-like nuclease
MSDAIDKIIHKLPQPINGETPARRVMTIRMPNALHLALKEEAFTRGVSVNQLVLAKLLVTGDALDSLVASNTAEDALAQ